MSTVPLTAAQSLRIRVMRFIGEHPSQPLDVTKRFGIEADDEAAYEAQLVTWGLLEAATLMPQPRYTITASGWTYIGLAELNGQALTVAAIKAAIPEGLFAGDDAAISAAVTALIGQDLVQASTGFTLNGN